MLDIFNVIAAIVSIMGFLLYAQERIKNYKKNQAEASNILVLKERIRSTLTTLKSTATNTHMLVQIGKSKSTDTEVMTNLSRSIRAELFALIKQLSGIEENLNSWKYGELLESFALDKDNIKINEQHHNEHEQSNE